MASTTTCTKPRSAAFTLVELMIATALGALGAAAVLSYILFSARSSAALDNYFDLNLKTQLAVDRLSQQIRQVQKLTACSTTNLTFQDYDGGALKYNYDRAAQMLTRTKNGAQDTLLTGCKSLQFSLFQRTPLSNTFQACSTATATNAKVIQISWNCTRSSSLGQTNSEGMKSALVVIRDK
jgi:prepilin-type N-terminal cleavage/methylation domain-containing protein